MNKDTVSDLRAEIEHARQRRSEDRHKFDASSCCCEAAIFDHIGTPIATISVADVAERMEGPLNEIGAWSERRPPKSPTLSVTSPRRA
ncbi:hypothetical protein [Nocardia sp. NPDC004123]